jgi:hypothetical protein
MSHPSPGELLEMHFGELDERARCAAHVASCAECARLLTEVEAVERALAPGLGDAPPADGLDRVLARVEGLRSTPARRDHPLRVVGPGLGVAALGAVAVHQGGAFGFLVFLAAGALVTLALAPVLILEAQRRPS